MHKKLLFALKKYWRHLYYVVVSKLLLLIKQNVAVSSIDESIEEILKNKLSVSRYGDGELRLIYGESIEFQGHVAALQNRLIEVIKSDNPGHLVCLPDVFTSLTIYKSQAAYFWELHLNKYFWSWIKLIYPGRVYGNAFLSRPYITFKNHQQSEKWFAGLKKIWNGKDVLIVEGASSRLGVGNNLFDNCKSIQRILCPSVNAFAKYTEILETVRKLSSNKLILLALGPTATILAYDLFLNGFQAIDIGHVDIEYEWFLMKANWKVNIPSKHTNEATSLLPEELLVDNIYSSEIIATIK